MFINMTGGGISIVSAGAAAEYALNENGKLLEFSPTGDLLLVNSTVDFTPSAGDTSLTIDIHAGV